MTVHDKIRGHLSAFGFDVSDMSDEAIDEGTERLAALSMAARVTAKQAHGGAGLMEVDMERKFVYWYWMVHWWVVIKLDIYVRG